MTSDSETNAGALAPVLALAGRLTPFLQSELLKSGYKNYKEWSHRAHAVAGTGAFIADVLYPLGDGALYAFYAALIAIAALSIAAWAGKVAAERAVAGLMFLCAAATLFGVLHVMEDHWGDKHGIVGKLLPPIKELQEKLIPALQKDVSEIKEGQLRQEAKLEEIAAQNRELLKRLSQEKGVPAIALVKILEQLGETRIAEDPAEIEKKLGEKADELLALQEQLAAVSGDDSQVAVLRKEAEWALGAADFAGARSKLREAAEIDRAAVAMLAERQKARAVSAAKTLEEGARVASVTLRYREAASDLGEAAKLVEPYDQRERWRLSRQQADALQLMGSEFGDNAALEEAIAVHRGALLLVSQADQRLDWAGTQNDLGNALTALGEREPGTERLEQGAAAYREALKVWTRESAPLKWAMAQHNLGGALIGLGERKGDSKQFEEAVAAYRGVLKEWTRDRTALQWGMAQDMLGIALRALGERETGTERLEEAVAASSEALKELTRERAPLQWAKTQNNLANALHTLGRRLWSLGQRKPASERLEQAVAAYREALKVSTRERVPLYWATTQNNLGNGLASLGEREPGTKRLEEAAAAYRESLKERTRERAPLQWAATQNSLGGTLKTLAEREPGTKRLEEAAAAYREALKERTRERAPLQWAATEENLGNVLSILGERESGTTRLDEAVAAYREVLKERAPERGQQQWAATQSSLGNVLRKIGDRLTESGDRATALAKYQEALKVREEILAATEEVEIKKANMAGKDTARQLGTLAWYALFARDFERARAASERALSLAPDLAWIRTNWAHAGLLLARSDKEKLEAKKAYLAHKGEKVWPDDAKLWEQVVAEDIAQLCAAGLDCRLLRQIEAELGAAK